MHVYYINKTFMKNDKCLLAHNHLFPFDNGLRNRNVYLSDTYIYV